MRAPHLHAQLLINRAEPMAPKRWGLQGSGEPRTRDLCVPSTMKEAQIPGEAEEEVVTQPLGLSWQELPLWKG